MARGFDYLNGTSGVLYIGGRGRGNNTKLLFSVALKLICILQESLITLPQHNLPQTGTLRVTGKKKNSGCLCGCVFKIFKNVTVFNG